MNQTHLNGSAMPKNNLKLAGVRFDSDLVVVICNTTYKILMAEGFSRDAIQDAMRERALVVCTKPIHPKGQEFYVSAKDNCEKRVHYFLTNYLAVVKNYRENAARGRYGDDDWAIRMKQPSLLKFLNEWGIDVKDSDITDCLDMSINDRLEFMRETSRRIIDFTMGEGYMTIGRMAVGWEYPLAVLRRRGDGLEVIFTNY